MEKKDLIIGVFNNFEFEVLKPWIYSIKKTGFVGDVILVAVGAKEEVVREIVREGVQVICVNDNNNMRIHMLRFLYIYDYLRNHADKYRYVISTDVRDVIFQKDPTQEMGALLAHHHLIAQSESIFIKDEEWNRDNIIKNFGEYFYQQVKNQEVYNVGILAGKAPYVKDLCFELFQWSLNRPDWVADQAAYNMILSSRAWSDITLKLNLHAGWAVNAHVTNKPDLKEKYGPFLLESRPYMDNLGTVRNAQGIEFTIVHQYDRVPEWMELYMLRFDFRITEKTNTGTAPKYFVYTT